jgi:hypothetical protein
MMGGKIYKPISISKKQSYDDFNLKASTKIETIPDTYNCLVVSQTYRHRIAELINRIEKSNIVITTCCDLEFVERQLKLHDFNYHMVILDYFTDGHLICNNIKKEYPSVKILLVGNFPENLNFKQEIPKLLMAGVNPNIFIQPIYDNSLTDFVRNIYLSYVTEREI